MLFSASNMSVRIRPTCRRSTSFVAHASPSEKKREVKLQSVVVVGMIWRTLLWLVCEREKQNVISSISSLSVEHWTSVNNDREWQALEKFRTPRWRRKKQNNRFAPFFYLRRLTSSSSSSTKMKRQTNFVFLVISVLLVFPSRETHEKNYDVFEPIVNMARSLLRWPENGRWRGRLFAGLTDAALSTHPRCASCRVRSCSSWFACCSMIFFSSVSLVVLRLMLPADAVVEKRKRAFFAIRDRIWLLSKQSISSFYYQQVLVLSRC